MLGILHRLNSNKVKYGAVLAYFQMGLNVLINLLYTPYLIRMLGKSEYGLYSTISSTIAMLTILHLGLNASYIRYLAKYKHEKAIDSIYRLNGLYLITFIIIGFIALVIGFIMTYNLEFIFSSGLTVEEYRIAQILGILATINISLSFPASVFSTIISANEEFVILKLVSMIKTVLIPVLMIPALILGYKSITLVVLTLIASIIADVVFYLYCRNKLQTKFYFNNFDKNVFKSIFNYSFFIALNTIIDQLNWNIDKCIIGRYKGTSAVAVYAVAHNLYMFYQTLSTSISGVFTPKIHRVINEYGDNLGLRNKELSSLFNKIGRIQFAIVMLVVSGVVFFGKQFIYYWVGHGYEEAYPIALLLMIPTIIPLVQNLGIEIQRAQNRHRFRSIVYLFMAISNFIISVYLCKIYGAIGCAIGTAITVLLAAGLIINIYYHKACGIDVISFWKTILRMSPGLILPFLLGIYINRFWGADSVWKYVLSIALYSWVYCISMWFISFNLYEKETILSLIRLNNKKER